MSSLYGSICLSDIPRSQIKKVMCKDGVERSYLNIFVGEKREPSTFGDKTYTHFVSCAPKKEERVEGEQYFIGDLQTFHPQQATQPARQPSARIDDNLPF